MNISGKDNEYEFVKYLNSKKVKEVNPLFRDVIDKLFNYYYRTDVIKCWLNKYPQKSDIFIKINNEIRGISLKKGIKNSVHVERISDFIHFLIENDISKDIVIKYLKYHYGDGSTNGKGLKRLSKEEYQKDHQDDIDKINEAFNKEEILLKAIKRFVIRGNNSNYDIDALIHGQTNDFLVLYKEQIIKLILSKKNYVSTGVHFGPLSVQPKNRCLNYNPLYEKDRYCVQIKWYNLTDDIIEYLNNEVMKKITN